MILEVDILTLLQFSILAIAIIVIAFLFQRGYKKIVGLFRGYGHGLNKKEIRDKWKIIELYVANKDEASYRLAIIEADKLLDYVLQLMSMPGKDFRERLNFATRKYKKLRAVGWAHGLRNKVVHETNFDLNSRSARAAIKAFKKALREVGAI